jgi:predicted ATPase/transcriptional regulator with GAF, ATPase, and Fis domain
VLLKTPHRSPPSASDIDFFRQEFELLQSLPFPFLPSNSELLLEDGQCVLVMPDPGGKPLSQHLARGRLPIEEFFRLSLRICEMLAELHRRDVVCCALQPQSLLTDLATGAVFLTDLSLASKVTAESPLVTPKLYPATLVPYISPEQTGRMSRAADYRTDFYSLGIVFYEMLTGSVPFSSSDLLELTHAHIARLPKPPAEVDPLIPQPVSGIVMRLLAKAAEQRYQSATGVRADLDRCEKEWRTKASISTFSLGAKDVSERFLIPQKLYGRDREVQALLGAFEDVCQGNAAITLVSGYSGIGKTSLIRELYRPIVSRNGYFLTGKFDQVVRNVPFGALIQAFRSLVRQLVTESDERLALWRERLTEALGLNGGVLAEVIPEIELVIGPQEPPPALGPAEALNRFQLVFQNFVGALAQRDHPLVVVLDDLQWADSATLSLLQPLLTSRDVRFLLLMGAYRENEVDAGHPLSRTLRTLESASAQVQNVSLGPLELQDLTSFIRDTIHAGLEEAEPLAQLVMEKTAGNPFFVIQFLKTLHQDGLIQFDYENQCWAYRLDSIRQAGLTDNVIDLMTRKIQRLPLESQRVMTLAACIGNLFELDTLAIVSQQSVEEAAGNLKEPVTQGLILPAAVVYEDALGQWQDNASLSHSSYGFLHDRVQQAAYALVSSEQKPHVHLQVGRLLRDRWDLNTAEEKIFDVVHHLNLGSALISGDAERLEVIRLNLNAGRKAKASTAFQSALSYFRAGINLAYDPNRWESEYDLMFSLHIERADCEYLCGHYEEADRCFKLLLDRARTRLDKAKVHRLRLVQNENKSNYAAAIECGREGLALLGVTFPVSEQEKQAVLEDELVQIQALIGGRTIGALADLPEMNDPEKRMVMRLLTALWSPTYITGDLVLTRLLSARIVRFSLAYGNTEESAYGYATHTITVGPIKEDFAAAYEWGKLALEVNERFRDPKQRAKVHQQFHAHSNLWRRPFRTCIPHAREAWRSGLEAGDFAYAGYGAFTETWNTMLICRNLDEFVRECSATLAMLEKVKMAGLVDGQKVIQHWALALQGRTMGPLSLSAAAFDEADYVRTYQGHPFFMTFLSVLKLHLCVLFEEFEPARETARQAHAVAGCFIGTIWPVLLDYYHGLALIASYPDTSQAERESCLTEIERIRKSLSLLSENCPENFRCAALLISAGHAGLCGNVDAEIDAYEEAIHFARETESLQNEALACELYGRFWQRRQNPEVAALYLNKAKQRYSSWGATAKAAQLEERHGPLLSRSGPVALPVATADSHRAGSTAEGQDAAASLDFAAVIKAARALTSEIVLEDLLRRLMRIALESAGAERGVFLQEKNGQWIVAAVGDLEWEEVTVEETALDSGNQALSLAVVHYVQKTGENVVVGEASADERFQSDPYIATEHPKSILCVPVVHQGKLGGILYLENNLASHSFTPERIEVMRILSSHAAVSLENARLYSEMQQEATQRRRAQQQLREIVEGTASAIGSDFFFSLVQHLASALQVRYAFAAECRGTPKGRARTLAFWKGDCLAENFEYDLAGTPCLNVIEGNLCHYPDQVARMFPEDKDLVSLEARSYLGIPILDAAGAIIGHLAVMDSQPMPEIAHALPVLKVFAARAGAELERLKAEDGLRAALAEVETLKNRLQAENVYLQEEIRREHNFQEIVGSSPALLALLRQVEQVAPADSAVLIYGETGTGKELIARAIHDRSLRRERPLVKVNCGAISAGLVESELFGHVKGAFTGAIENRSGRFELADGGTLFLDEVGELPLETQVKLLRVLQEQEFEPVGSSRTMRVDVRIIAASNRDLAQGVAAGLFRSDLFYRLNVFPLTVPPLRERQSDIPQLVLFFLSRFSRTIGKPIDTVSQESMRLLQRYSWPGNIRELQNVVQRAVVLSPGPVLNFESILLPTLESSQPVAISAAANAPSPVVASPAKRGQADGEGPRRPASTLEQVERQHILDVLRQTGGQIEGPKGAAKILNLHPNTLRSRMKKLGIQRTSH